MAKSAMDTKREQKEGTGPVKTIKKVAAPRRSSRATSRPQLFSRLIDNGKFYANTAPLPKKKTQPDVIPGPPQPAGLFIDPALPVPTIVPTWARPSDVIAGLAVFGRMFDDAENMYSFEGNHFDDVNGIDDVITLLNAQLDEDIN